jgi:hypothetical protein
MAKKKAKPVPDADGYTHTGIYVKAPRKNLLPILLGENDGEAQRLVDEWNMPPAGRLAEIRDWLAKIILPWVDGPLTEKQARKIYDRMIFTTDFGKGVKIYAVKSSLAEQDQWRVDAFNDACDAVYQAQVVAHNLKPGGNPTLLFKATYRLGQLRERIQVRAHEPDAQAGKNIIKGVAVARKSKLSHDDLREEAIKAIGWAEHNFPEHRGEKVFINKKAAAHQDIKLRAHYDRLKEPEE